MPNATVRANARTMPKAEPAENPDAKLIALARECGALAELHLAKVAVTDAARRMTQVIEPPKALFRTEEDLQNGLFVGRDGVGKPYDREDIALLRPLCRRMGRDTASSYKDFKRVQAICEHWLDWTQRVEDQEAETGLRAAYAVQGAAVEKYEAAAKKLITMPVFRLRGLVAKACAFRTDFPPDADLANKVAVDLENFGVDEEVLALSLARDVLRLALATEA